MRLRKLQLRNFRNCANLDLNLDSNKVIITGKNGQGKTNILESIRFLSTLKSPRTSDIKDFVKFDTDGFSILCEFQKSGISVELKIEYSPGKTKILKLNGLRTIPKNYKAALNTVLFTVEDLLLLRGSPQNRRDWLDSAISQIYPAHDERLNKYNKIRTQKNNLLKEPVIDMDLLDVFDEQIMLTGANIIYVRKKFLSELKKYAVKKYNEIISSENFSFEYSFPHSDIENIAKMLEDELKRGRNEEISRHQSCIGPHRDDIYFYLNNSDALKFSSQGQQRTIVLALKLAEIELIKNKNGYSPILLLDDVLAELDDLRQNYLLKSISKNTQTIITSVESLVFKEDFLNDASVYKIADGIIVD